MSERRAEIERAVEAALETYANIHRGSGHHSVASTRLYERAREIVLERLGVGRRTHAVVFCTPRRAAALRARIGAGGCRILASRDLGLPLGIDAVVLRRSDLPAGPPFETGGGTARLVGPGWVVWARQPERLEAGTPPLANVIAFVSAFQRGDAARVPGEETPPAEESAREPGDDVPGACEGRELLRLLRQTLIGRDALVPVAGGEVPFVNLDNAASTPAFEPVWAAVRRAWRLPVEARPDVVAHARAVCARVLGADPSAYDVHFTSNTTEAINVVARSLGEEAQAGGGAVVVNTLLEHNSNELPWRSTPGITLLRLPVDREGFLDPADLDRLLSARNGGGRPARERVRLVTVCGASNVLGTCNDLAKIARVAHRHGALLLVDAAQLVAHRRVEMGTSGIDGLVFSGHKVYAPFGTGALVARKGMLSCGPHEMESIRASGEENIGGIAGLAASLELLERIGFDTIQEEERALTTRALSGMARIPGVRVLGVQEPGSPRFVARGGVIAFEVKGRFPHQVARALAERGGIGVRYGCHCAHLLIKHLAEIPPWAEQLQRVMVTVAPRLNLPGVVRISFGLQTTEADVDRFLEVLAEVVRRPKAPRAGRRIDEYAEAAVRRVYAGGQG